MPPASAPGRCRVLHLIDSLGPGGAERSLVEITPYLLEGGVTLHVGILEDRDGFRPELEAMGVAVHSLVGRGGRLGAVRRTHALIGDVDPHVVHTSLFESDLAGRTAAALGRVPVLSSLVNVGYGQAQRDDPQIRRWKLEAARLLDASTARLAARFHAVSDIVADAMAKTLHIPRSRIEVIHRGRDERRLGRRTPERRRAARQMLGADDDAIVLLAVARHEYQKGLDVLVTALPAVRAAHPTARLVVAGREGNQTAELVASAARAGVGDCVQLLGARDDVPDLLCAADAFVMPSRREGLPGAMIEAMGLEAPIVASAIGPVREVAGGSECATLVAPDDAPALAAAIVATLADHDLVRRTARGRRRFEEEFTAPGVAARMQDLYERVSARVDGPARRPR